MARLIDANDIPWEEHYVPDSDSDKQWAFKKELCVLKPVVDQMPTVDAIEVVRCHDCQHSEPCKPYNKVWCPKMGRYMNADGFCSEGVKKA